jgi:hypothetical protein
MAIFHCQAKAVSRSSGRSATASAAYRSGESITDRRTGEVYDYEKKQGVGYKEIITPDGSQIDRSELWNRVEEAEKRKDAKVAREWELALPSELTAEQRKDLACTFARMLVDRYGVVADVCIHEPSRMSDQRNHHAHILTTTRTYADGILGEKTRILDSPKTSGKEVEYMRQAWANFVNRSLEWAGHDTRIDHRNLEAQGVDRLPTCHLGPAATAMERRGIQTERGDLNRARRDGQIQAIETELAGIKKQQQGIEAARQRLHVEMATCATEKAASEERERQRKQEEAEKERKRQAERAALEKQYGQAVRILVLPEAPGVAHTYLEYGKYLDRLQEAMPEKRAEMVKDLQKVEYRYSIGRLFYSVAEGMLPESSIASRQTVRDEMLKKWDRATSEQRKQMELEAKEAIKTYERERSHGLSMGR